MSVIGGYDGRGAETCGPTGGLGGVGWGVGERRARLGGWGRGFRPGSRGRGGGSGWWVPGGLERRRVGQGGGAGERVGGDAPGVGDVRCRLEAC